MSKIDSHILAYMNTRRPCLFLLCLMLQWGWISPSYAQTEYWGPPYTNRNDEKLYQSAGAAIQAYLGEVQPSCDASVAPSTCKFSVKYKDPNKFGGCAAWVSKDVRYQDGSVNHVGDECISATHSSIAVTKNVGNSTACTCEKGGEGNSSVGSSPRGSSGDSSLNSQPHRSYTVLEGDPINTSTGNKFQQETDYGCSPWLTFRRFYNSIGYVSQSTLGAQWRHSFDRSLEVIQLDGDTHASTAYLYRPDASRETFTYVNGTWAAEADNPDALVESVDASGNITSYTVTIASLRHSEKYSASGLLESVTDPNGQGIDLTYSTASTPTTTASKPNLLLTVTDTQGRKLDFKYNSQGNLAETTLPDNGVLFYSYDATSGLLTSVQYPDGRTRRYVYNESSLTNGGALPTALTGVIDEAGVRYETTGYDFYNRGFATSTSFASGADKTSISYGSGTLTATLTTPLGAKIPLYFKNILGAIKPGSSSSFCGLQCNQSIQSIGYDANGYPSTSTDFKNVVTKTTYDANGLLDQQIDASSTSSQRTTNTTWNTTLRVPLTRTVQDANNNTVSSTQWVYNTRGQALARCETDPTNSAASGYACSNTGTVPAGVRRWTYTYCNAVDTTQCPLVGLLLTATGPRTDLTQTTTYSYYLTASAVNCGTPGAACHQPGDLYQVTDALGHVTTYTSYDADGRPTRLTDANGITTDLTYTPRSWLASRSVGGTTTHFTYTPYGAVQTVTDPDGVTTTYGYDDAHRLTKITDALGNSIQYTLDAAGDKTAELVYDASGTLHKKINRTFNTLGQLTTVIDGLNHTVFDASASGNYDANGNLVQSSDGLGIERQQSYDALDRLVQTLDNYNGTDAATQNTSAQYAYDSLDRLTQVTDPSHLATTYRYDGLSDATGQTSPDTGATSGTFDAAGNMLTRTDAKGVTATYTYDALDRLVGTTYPDSTQNVAYHYDEANSVTGCNANSPIGRLTRVIESAVTTVYCYDNQGRVIAKRQTMGTTTDTTGYAYTAAGRLSGVVYPSGTQVSYARDGDGRLQSVAVTPPNDTASTAVSSVTYQPFGPVSSYTLGNGQAVARTYDANYRLTDLTSPAFSLHVARDAMGDITALGNAPGANPATETYGYDPLYRLTAITEANGSVLESATYNPIGDRLSKSGSGLATGTYSYKPNTHQLIATGSHARVVDANGNTAGITAASGNLGFGYNDRNRLAVAQIAGSTVANYTYDALGERIGKVTGTASERYGYDEGQQLLSEQGATNRDYVWMDDIPVANVDTSGTTSTLAYVTTDQLGTPRTVADVSGTTVWQLPYQGNAWGEVLPTSASGYTYNLRFSGQYFDAESGLSNNVNRDYDSATGRYVESDPIGLDGGISAYAYVGGNPLTRTDPLGLACNSQGCWNTPQERAYAQAGDWKNYYATACASGDPYACEGGNVAKNQGILSGITNYRLASSIADRLPPGKTCAADQAIIDQNMEKIREALVAARAAQLDAAGATPDNPVMVTGQSISDFHNQVFQANGAGPVFGGDIPGANALLQLSNIGSGGYGWCTAPACH